jgi:hypothetical protein
MSKVMNQIFLGSQIETDIALSSDPEYEKFSIEMDKGWSEELENELQKQFSDKEPEETPVF